MTPKNFGQNKYYIKTLLRIQWRFNFANVILFSRPRLWVGYFAYFKFTPVFYRYFNSIKEISRSRKWINRILRKGMSSLYLKVTIKKNWRSEIFDFLSFKNLSQFATSCCNLKIRRLGAKLPVSFPLF